jgi:hypothetical protein
VAARYHLSSRSAKRQILDELCAATGWHRDHARKSLRSALTSAANVAPAGRRPLYDEQVIDALRFCWELLERPCGKRLAPVLPALADRLQRLGELTVDERTADALRQLSAATIDRRLAADRARIPGPAGARRLPTATPASSSLRKSGWNNGPGLLGLEIIGDNGPESGRPHCVTLVAADITTGWREATSFRGGSPAALNTAIARLLGAFPFPVRAVEVHAPPGPVVDALASHSGASALTLLWTPLARDGARPPGPVRSGLLSGIVSQVFETEAECALLNRAWAGYGLLANYFYPHQQLVHKARQSERRVRKYGIAATPYERVVRWVQTPAQTRGTLRASYEALNPAALRRDLQRLSAELRSAAGPVPR